MYYFITVSLESCVLNSIITSASSIQQLHHHALASFPGSPTARR